MYCTTYPRHNFPIIITERTNDDGMASEICRLPLSASDRALCLGWKGPIGAHAQSLLADGQTRRFVPPIGPCTGMGAADEPRPVTPRTLHIFPSEHHNFFNAFRRTFAIVHYGGGPKSNARNLGSGRHPIPDTTSHKKNQLQGTTANLRGYSWVYM